MQEKRWHSLSRDPINHHKDNNVDVGDPVTATDGDNDTLTYTLAGEDTDFFEINRLHRSNTHFDTARPRGAGRRIHSYCYRSRWKWRNGHYNSRHHHYRRKRGSQT